MLLHTSQLPTRATQTASRVPATLFLLALSTLYTCVLPFPLLVAIAASTAYATAFTVVVSLRPPRNRQISHESFPVHLCLLDRPTDAHAITADVHQRYAHGPCPHDVQGHCFTLLDRTRPNDSEECAASVAGIPLPLPHNDNCTTFGGPSRSTAYRGASTTREPPSIAGTRSHFPSCRRPTKPA